MSENLQKQIKLSSGVVLNASLVRVPWSRTTSRNQSLNYFNLLSALCINNHLFELIEIDEDEYNDKTKSEEFGIWIPIDETLSDTMSNRLKAYKKKGLDIPFQLSEDGKRIKVANQKYLNDVLIPMQYGRIEIHKFGKDTSLIWIHFNKKIYAIHKDLIKTTAYFTQCLSEKLGKDAIYLYSSPEDLNHSKLIYFARGQANWNVSGKDTWEQARKTYGIDKSQLMDICFTHNDIELAVKDIQVLENNMRELRDYVPFVGGAKDPDDPNLSLTNDQRLEIKEKMHILDNMMVERTRLTQLIGMDSDVETIFFEMKNLKSYLIE